jgi:hypothetical protein
LTRSTTPWSGWGRRSASGTTDSPAPTMHARPTKAGRASALAAVLRHQAGPLPDPGLDRTREHRACDPRPADSAVYQIEIFAGSRRPPAGGSPSSDSSSPAPTGQYGCRTTGLTRARVVPELLADSHRTVPRALASAPTGSPETSGRSNLSTGVAQCCSAGHSVSAYTL